MALLRDVDATLARLQSDLLSVWVDTDRLPGLATRYGIVAIPSLSLFVDGQIHETRLSRPEPDELEQWLSLSLEA